MADNIPNISQEDINANKGMAALSYLGFLFLIPMLSKKDSQFCRYHVNQGIILFIIEVAGNILFNILGMFLGIFTIIGGVFWLAYVVLIILGIVNATTGKVKPLPLIGGFTLYK